MSQPLHVGLGALREFDGVVARLIIVSAERGLPRSGVTPIAKSGYSVAVIPRRWCDSIGGDVRAVLDATNGSSKASVMTMQRRATVVRCTTAYHRTYTPSEERATEATGTD